MREIIEKIGDLIFFYQRFKVYKRELKYRKIQLNKRRE